MAARRTGTGKRPGIIFQFFSYDNNNNNYNNLTYEAVFHTFITPHSLIMSPQCLGILLAQCELG